MNNNSELNNNFQQNQSSTTNTEQITSSIPNNMQQTPTEIQDTTPIQPTSPVPTIPVAPNIEKQTSLTQDNNNKSDDPEEISVIALMLIISLIAVLIAVSCFYIFKNDDKKAKEPTVPTMEDTKKDDFASSWNGTYTSNDILITIYQSAPNVVSINISTSSTNGNTVGGSYIGFEADVTSETKIVYDDDFLEEGANIVIEKTDNGIMIISSSDVSDSLLNNINGNYNKEAFTEYGWSGTYQNEDVSIILSEISESSIMCTIIKGYSEISFSFSEISETTLNYLDSWDNDSITITKANNGLEITANSEDSESLLNKINGIYTKQ